MWQNSKGNAVRAARRSSCKEIPGKATVRYRDAAADDGWISAAAEGDAVEMNQTAWDCAQKELLQEIEGLRAQLREKAQSDDLVHERYV